MHALRAESAGEAIEAVDTRPHFAAALDVAEVGAADTGALGKRALVDLERGTPLADPIAERRVTGISVTHGRI